MIFPYSHWKPLSVTEVQQLFTNVPFHWGLAGGYAVEQFLGTAIRPHSDIDVLIYRTQRKRETAPNMRRRPDRLRRTRSVLFGCPPVRCAFSG